MRYHNSKLIRTIDKTNKTNVLYTYTEKVEGQEVLIKRYKSNASPSAGNIRENGEYLKMSSTYRTISIEELG